MGRTLPFIWLALGVIGCRAKQKEQPGPGSHASGPPPRGDRMQWSGDDPGWVAGFADYPRGQEQAWNFSSDVRPLPAPLSAPHRSLYIGGDNHSDDLFMFWKRNVTGLAPNTAYDAALSVTFATNAPAHCSGAGGAPGESVYMKAGVSTTEPVVSGDDVRISIDKGDQAVGGKDAVTIGDVATTNVDCKTRQWQLKTLRTKSAVKVTSDGSGALWIIVGTDSGFEARTEIYYTSIEVTLDKAGDGRKMATTEAANGESITPVPLPDPKIAGFKFPETEPTVEGWSKANDKAAMAKHAWGLWTAITTRSGHMFHGEDLRVFETWATPDDLLSDPSLKARGAANPRPLGELRQFRHTMKSALFNDHGDETVTGFVKFDPDLTGWITKNDLLSATKLASFKNAGTIPDFPASAIALKPIYQTLPASSAVAGRYAQLAYWPGPPTKPAPFPQSKWNQCIWIDLQDTTDGPGTTVDTKCAKDGSSRTPASTYGLGRFIHFQLSPEEAELRNDFIAKLEADTKSMNLTRSKAGDYAVLLGMHVTTREITRWTWATFWWTATPDHPAEPSSQEIADQRPAELTGAARSYAHCEANMMEFPPQPNTGGKNEGESVYCYNPWLEAAFGPSSLPDSLPGTYKGKKVANNVGVQTNCMSCHAQAHFDPDKPVAPEDHFTGDRYVDLAGPFFKGKVRVDFLWSVADRAR